MPEQFEETDDFTVYENFDDFVVREVNNNNLLQSFEKDNLFNKMESIEFEVPDDLDKQLIFNICYGKACDMWFEHQIVSHYISGSDRAHIWLNLLFLMSISLIPFSASLLGENLSHRSATTFYGINLFVTGVIQYLDWEV